MTVPHPPHCFFLDHASTVTLFSLLGMAPPPEDPRLGSLGSLGTPAPRVSIPLVKGFRFGITAGRQHRERDECANPDGAGICGATDPLAGGGLSWKEKTGGPR